MSDISESVIEEIRKLHGPDADDILSAMQQDEGEERRQKQREAEEYLINKAYEESLKEAKAKQTAVLTRAQISESVMGAVLDAAAAKLMEEFQRPSGRRDTQRTVDESTIIRKILEESEKAEIERRRRLAEEERKVAMAVRVAIEKSKEETQTKARQDRAAMEAELARMKKQLQEDADRLADEKAQLVARREAEVRAVKKREEELRAETARMEAEMARREEERRRRELDDAREERERERERERAKQKAKDEEAKERAARLAKEKAESERRQQQEHQRAREEAVAVAEATRKQEQKAREEALSRELQQREHQLKAREDRSPARGSPRVQDWISQSVLGPPKPQVSIYTQGGTALSVSEIKTFLMSVDPTLKEAEIFAHEFTHDYELANFIKEKCPHDTFPVVCIHGTPIGDLATLKLNRQHIPALLRGEMLELPSQQKKDVTTSLGVLDSALNVGEYVLSGVGSLLTLPVKILAWPFSSKATEPKPDAEEPEFQCIHQNWYYRNLVRVFRFREKGFVRVHPTHKDVRAEHEYSTIAVVTLTDAENMIINYNDGSAPDYIKASEADLKEMIRIIKTRSPKEIQVVVESS